MKKIFTLLFSTAMLSTAFAQYGQRDKHDDVIVYNNNQGYEKYDKDFDRDGRNYDRYGKGYGRGAYIFTAREKDMQIAHIQHDFEHQVQEVRSSYGMSWQQKKQIIHELEHQRDESIEMVWRKFKSPRNRFGDYGRRNDRRW